MKAVRCPICAGTGEYYAGTIDCEGKLIGYRACHGCKDKDGISRGWVEVNEEHNQFWYPMPSGASPAYYPGLAPPEDWPEPFYITGDITVSMGNPATG